jgi:hypothetical protein
VSPPPIDAAPPLDNAAIASDDPGSPNWPDDFAESAFLADARERGETVAVKPAPAADPPEDPEPKALPSMEELVNRIPAEVREALDDLFRARFVTVKRVPKRALK